MTTSGPSIREIHLANGRTRYKATIDVAPPRNGKRFQRSITGDTTAEVEAAVTRLAVYTRPRTRPDVREQLEESGLIPAPVLAAAGSCTAMCLFALEDHCECRCRGAYHGRLQHLYLDALVDTGPSSPYPPLERVAAGIIDRARLLAHHGLRAVRMNAGLTQEAVARATGGAVHPAQLGRAERGLFMLRLPQLLAVSAVLGLGQATLDDVAAWLNCTPDPDGRRAGGHIISGSGQAQTARRGTVGEEDGQADGE